MIRMLTFFLAMLPSLVLADNLLPDPSKQITLTFGELQQIVAAQIAIAQSQQATANAKAANEHLQSQIAPTPAEEKK